MVGVRDVADLRLLAMTNPAAVGERFLAAAGQPLTMPEIAAILRSRLGRDARRVPTHDIPDWLVRAAVKVVPPLRELVDLLGPPKPISTAKVTELLGWQPISAADTIAATGESLIAAAGSR